MIALRYTPSIQDQSVVQEFESFAVQLKAVFLVAHDEDGNQRVDDRPLALTPVGGMMDWPTDTPPRGWLICNGDQVSRVTYKGLFDVIGTTFGAGDGSTTFNLPDARGRFSLSKAASGTGSSIGNTGGSLDHTHGAGSFSGSAHTHGAGSLAVDSHSHSAGTLAGPSHTHTGPSHSHSISSDGSHTHSMSGSTASESSHTHSFSATSGLGSDAGVPSAIHYAGGTATNHRHDVSGTTGAGSSHSHGIGTIATGSAGSHDHGASTGSAGTGNTGASGTGAVTGSTGSTAPGISGSTASDGGGAISGSSGTANPAFIVLGNKIIFTGIAA